MAQCGDCTWSINLYDEYKWISVPTGSPSSCHEDKQLSLGKEESWGQAWRPEVPQAWAWGSHKAQRHKMLTRVQKYFTFGLSFPNSQVTSVLRHPPVHLKRSCKTQILQKSKSPQHLFLFLSIPVRAHFYLMKTSMSSMYWATHGWIQSPSQHLWT